MENELLFLIAYFYIYAFVGWILESVYKTVLERKIINSGFLLGPFCPIYGFGALIMYLSLRDLTDNIFILFVFGIIFLSVFEYIVGIFLEIVFKTKYWDYSEKKFNIHGRVCLQNSLYWGVLGVLFMRVIHPGVEKIVKDIPVLGLVISISVLCTIIFIDTFGTIIKLIKINSRLKTWDEITKDIKSKIDAVNERTAVKFENINKWKINYNYTWMKKISESKNRDDILGKLKLEQQRLQEKLEKRLARLRKAFPTMKSDRLSNFLNNMKKS